MEGHLAALSEIAGIDLKAHGTTSDEETIKDTAVAQPLIVAAGLVAAKSLFDVELNTLPVVLGGTRSARSRRPPSPGCSAKTTR